MSRFAADPKWLIYLPPTMSPSETSKHASLLEHPQEAFAYYRNEGVPTVICEQKHMGSRAVVILCRDESVSQRRFGVVAPANGTVYTRTGRRFFNSDELKAAFLMRSLGAAEKADLWAQLNTDWVCLDCELMPWSAKAQELLRQQYAPVGNAGIRTLTAEQHVLAQALERLSDLDELGNRTTQRLHAMQQYVREYQQYCWPVQSLDDFKLAPFHVLASEGSVHVDKRHTWHMEVISMFCAADERLLLATPFQLVDLNDTASCDAAVAWWTDLTSAGREGMVVKPPGIHQQGTARLYSTSDQMSRPGVPSDHLRTRISLAGESRTPEIESGRSEALSCQPGVCTWHRGPGALRPQRTAS